MCKFCFLVKKILTGPYDTARSTFKEVDEHKGIYFLPENKNSVPAV